ncbi:hypothetical protein Tco_0953574 [Tanacetum coccineum]|uniref:Reverse transcriptase domain-containing protein n=1 Tax=Tanacetum coccineum TaxID=301880 RepID=A0ABQ5E474_9ASTR
MPTEMELTLEQTQQGVSYEVSNIRVISFIMKMEILLESTSNKLMVEHAEFDESNTHVLERFYTSAGNPVNEILLKLNLPDHMKLKDGGEEMAKLTDTVTQQTSAMISAMTAMMKQLQATTALASIKANKESCVTCGGAHSYPQCPATDGNTFSGYQDNIQLYVSAAAVNYNQGNTGYRP